MNVDDAHPLLQRLSEMQTMSFRAWSDDNAWLRQGSGRLSVNIEPAQLTIRESGSWHERHQQSKQFAFDNVWLYRIEGEFVDLAHLRFGDQRPVRLCRLVERAAGLWVSLNPHICGQDCYSVQVDLRERAQIMSHWTISGQKSEHKHIIYRA